MSPNNKIQKAIKLLENGSFIEKMTATKTLKLATKNQPDCLVPYFPTLIQLLEKEELKVGWAVLFFLAPIGEYNPSLAFENLGLFGNLADGKSVILRDAYVKILSSLTIQKYEYETCITLLMDEVLKAPINQVPSYAQQAFQALDETYAAILKNVILSRLEDAEEHPAKLKKLKGLVGKLDKILR